MSSKDLTGGFLKLRKLDVVDIALDNFEIRGNVVFDKNVEVQGNLELDGNLTLNGNIGLGQIDLNGVNGNIETTGSITAGSIANTDIEISNGKQVNVVPGGQINIQSGAGLDFQNVGNFDLRVYGDEITYTGASIPILRMSRDTGSRENLLGGFSTGHYSFPATGVIFTTQTNIGNAKNRFTIENPNDTTNHRFIVPYEGLNEDAGDLDIFYNPVGNPTNSIIVEGVSAGGAYGAPIFKQLGNTGTNVNQIPLNPGQMLRLYAFNDGGDDISYLYQIV